MNTANTKSQRTRSGPSPLVLRGELEGGLCAVVKNYICNILYLIYIIDNNSYLYTVYLVFIKYDSKIYKIPRMQ